MAKIPAAKEDPLKTIQELSASYLKYKICVSGSAETEFCPPGTVEKAMEIGALVATRGMVLVTGATTGIPYWAAKGAKEAGGIVIGLSPAVSKLAHVKTYRLPIDYHDLIIYTGFDYLRPQSIAHAIRRRDHHDLRPHRDVERVHDRL